MAKKKAKRRTNRTPKGRSAKDWSGKFLEALRREGTIYHACQDVNVGRSTVYDRRDSDPAFAALLAAAIEDATDTLEREAVRRGRDGYPEPVVYQGKMMGWWVDENNEQVNPDTPGASFVPLTVRKFSDSLLGLLLKARRYADHHVVTGLKGGPVGFIFVGEDDDEAGSSPDRAGDLGGEAGLQVQPSSRSEEGVAQS